MTDTITTQNIELSSWDTLYIHLRIPSGFFPSHFPTKTLYSPLLSPTHATCPAHLILLDVITRIIFCDEYRSWRSSLCSLLHFPVTSSLLDPDIFLNILFSNTLSLCSFLILGDQVSNPDKTTGKISSVYLNLYIFGYTNWGGGAKDLCLLLLNTNTVLHCACV